MKLSQVLNTSIPIKINAFAMKKDNVIFLVGGHFKRKEEDKMY